MSTAGTGSSWMLDACHCDPPSAEKQLNVAGSEAAKSPPANRRALPDLMIVDHQASLVICSDKFSNFFPELLSFVGEITIEQKQAKHYIDHDKYVHIGIVEELAVIYFAKINGHFPIGTTPVYLSETIDKKPENHCNKEYPDSPDNPVVDITACSGSDMQPGYFFHHIFSKPQRRLFQFRRLKQRIYIEELMILCFPFCIRLDQLFNR